MNLFVNADETIPKFIVKSSCNVCCTMQQTVSACSKQYFPVQRPLQDTFKETLVAGYESGVLGP
jgi:hypothetical protein